MELTARDIHEKQFQDAWRGYRQEEVDEFLDRVAESLDRIHRENDALRKRTRELEQTVAASRDTEEMLKKTLVTAQQAAEEAIGKAKSKAEQLVSQAEERARQADAEARQRVSGLEGEVRRRAAEVEREHAARRRELEASIEHLRGFETELRHKLRGFLEQQLAGLDKMAEHPSVPGGTTSKPRPGRRARARVPDEDEARTPSGDARGSRSLVQPRPGPAAAAEVAASSVVTDPQEALAAEDESRQQQSASSGEAGDPKAPRRGVRGLLWRDEGSR